MCAPTPHVLLTGEGGSCKEQEVSYSRLPQVLVCAVMIVSPSRAHALVDAAVPNVSVLYEVLSLPTFRYRLVLVDWTVVSSTCLLRLLSFPPALTAPVDIEELR